jgi:hypothetical protein
MSPEQKSAFPRRSVGTSKLRKRDEQLGEYVGTNCSQVAMQSATGKLRKTLAATNQQLCLVCLVPTLLRGNAYGNKRVVKWLV